MSKVEKNSAAKLRDDAPYWAAAMVIAIRDRDTKRAADARRRLRHLGFIVGLASELKGRKEVAK